MYYQKNGPFLHTPKGVWFPGSRNQKGKIMNFLEKTGIVATVIVCVLSLIFSPVLTFGCAYVGGMILDWIVGAKLVDGLNLMFDTTRFTRSSITKYSKMITKEIINI